MSAAARDLRLGLRTLRKSPALSAVCIIALSFGIGLTTMMFSIIYGAMLRGLPYENGDRIVALQRSNPEQGINQQSIPVQDYHDLVKQQKSLAQFGAYTSGTMNVSGREKAERFQGSWVTSNLLPMTGIRPQLGRAFLPGEDVPGGPKVTIISHGMWQNRFGGERSVLGTTIRMNGQPYEIIGVMPEDFLFPNNDDLWVPLQTDPLASERGAGQYLNVVGMRDPDMSLDQVNVEMSTISKRLEAEFPKANAGYRIQAQGFVDQFIGPQPRQLLLTMLGAVFFVLLIACTNVANLLLDRAAHRTKEVGVRSALGASRAAIMRVFLSEALVLAIVGTIVGIGIAYAGITVFNRAIVDTRPPFFISIALYPPVLLFATGVALLATLFSGLIPALQASRADISEVLKDESRGSSSLRIGRISKALVVFEVALSCGLLVAAGLMVKSVAKATSRDTGFATQTVFTARIGFPVAYTDTAAQRLFFEQLNERIAAIPGVEAGAISDVLPGAQQGLDGTRFALEGKSYTKDLDHPLTRTAAVTPSFFETLQIPLRTGRLFTSADRLGSLDVAIVNERFVREHFKNDNPLGRRIRYGTGDTPQPWLTIVGVVPDIFAGDAEDPRPAIVYRPFAQAHANFAYISARTSGPPMQLTEPVRSAVASLNSDIPIYWPMTLDAAIAQPLWFVRVFGTMFMVFGVVALFLASIGLYAVMSFSVSRRAREVGIRMALGATARDVVRMIMSQGAWQLGIGLVLGLALAAGISRVMTVVLFDVQPLDAAVFGGVTILLAVTGAIACLLPARRATLVDPSDAIRSD
jgi:predicted permease